MRKIAALIGAGAMLLSVATPALGWYWPVSSKNNTAVVTNQTTAGAYTGNNQVGNEATVGQVGIGMWSWNKATTTQTNTVSTGKADAEAVGVVAANTQVGCGCYRYVCGPCGNQKETNTAFVNNGTQASASTGGNVVYNDVGVGQLGSGNTSNTTQTNTVKTGAADAEAVGVVVVNTQLSWGN